nr:heparinase II/III-family protein [Nocardioides soli]
MDAIVHVDGEVAVFNDAAIGDAVTPSSVGWVPSAAPRDLVLTDAGYAHIIRDRLSVIFDAGPMGPREVLGHGHADFLSIQVCIAGARVVVDPGVAAIAAGRDRDWTRSAESHNGPTYGGVEPAEFFGAWRVGWSGTASLSALVRHSEREVELAGTADGYSRFGGGVSRRLIVSDDAVLLRDTWVPIRGRQMVSRFIVDEAWRIDSTESALGLRHHSGARAQFSLTTGTLGSIRAVHHFPRGPSEPCLGREIEFLAPDGLLELEIRAL